jgi:DNA-binding FadR family transcriptional regulator
MAERMAVFPAARISRAEELARHLEQEIVDGDLAAGTRLGTKEDLRRRSGFAVATVNEAVRLLETRGLIVARSGPGGGVFVAGPATRVRLNHLVLGFKADERPITDCLKVRNQLEPLICEEASARCGTRDAATLRKAIAEMEAHADRPAEFLRLNWALHRRLARMGDNAALTTIYLTLMDFIEQGLDDVSSDEYFDSAANLAIHRDLVEAIIEGDPKRLTKAIRRHTPVAERWLGR